MEKVWRKLNGEVVRQTGEVVRQTIVDEIREVIVREKEQGYELKVCIGTAKPFAFTSSNCANKVAQ